MANADLKTKKTQASVSKFIDGIADQKRREDCRRVVDIMKKATNAEPKMWGSSVVGFGRLGKHKTGKGCLYIKSLDDVDMKTLRELVTASAGDLKKPKVK